MGLPDVVYIVREGDVNEELRYSIRSIQDQLPYGRLVVAGYCPSWLKPDEVIVVPKEGSKWASAERNLREAIDSNKVSDPFYCFNDDFFLMQAFPEGIPLITIGTIASVIQDYRRKFGTSFYLRGMIATYNVVTDLLLGMREPMSFEAHTPILLDKEGIEDTLSRKPPELEDYHWRTVYGNLYGDEVVAYSEDVKVYANTPPDRWSQWPLLSTSDMTFRKWPVGRHIRDNYPVPSRYEL